MRLSTRWTGQNDVRRELNQVRSDLDRLRTDLRDVVGAVGEIGRENLGELSDSARGQVSDRMRSMNRQYARWRRQGSRQWARCRRSVSAHPFATLLVALGLGTLIAALTGAAYRFKR